MCRSWAIFLVSKPGEANLSALTYAVKGDIDEPALSINPLSALTPGIFRRIFEYAGPKEPVAVAPGTRADNDTGAPTSAIGGTLPRLPVQRPRRIEPGFKSWPATMWVNQTTRFCVHQVKQNPVTNARAIVRDDHLGRPALAGGYMLSLIEPHFRHPSYEVASVIQ